MKVIYRGLALLVIPFLVVGVAHGASLPPELVSPGALQKTVEIADRCPTFNWSSEERASIFELAIYQFPTEDLSRSGPAPELAPIIRIRVPGAARGWTPSLEHCLDPGGRYAWTLRAVAGIVPSRWAEPRMFTISASPSSAEVETALNVLQMYLEDVQSDRTAPIDLPAAGEGPLLGTKTSELETPLEAVEIGTSRPEGTGIAAIRGEVSDPTGETYGVEGISNSPDGAGLSAENTTDETDLLLLGNGVAPDARLTESTLDRVSDSDQTFDFRNSGAGMMTLQVESADVITTLTDSDTLGGLACASTEIAKWSGSIWECVADENDDTLGDLSCANNQVPQWNGAAWVCANTGTDTLAGLSCGSGQVVHWNGSVWTCGQPTLTHATCTSSNSCSAACATGSIVWTGGCTASPSSATLIKSTPTSAGSGQPPTGWECSAFNPLGGATVIVDLYCVSQ